VRHRVPSRFNWNLHTQQIAGRAICWINRSIKAKLVMDDDDDDDDSSH